jgi:hypothetical protein
MCARSRAGALLTEHPTADTEGGVLRADLSDGHVGSRSHRPACAGLPIRRMVRRPARCSTMWTSTGHGDPFCLRKFQPTRSRPSTVTGPL